MNIDITAPANVAILIGFLLILGAAHSSFTKWRLITKGEKAIGKVIDSYIPKTSERLPLTIKVQFTTHENTEQIFTEQPLKRSNYPVSSEVEVIYDKNHPGNAHILKNEFLWLWEFLFFSCGAGMVLVGFLGE